MKIDIIILAIIGIVLISGCVQQEQQSEKIRIGFVGPLSGDGSAYGLPAKNIVEYTVEEINNAGGINGRKIEIVYEDGKCTAKDGLAAAQSLVELQNVSIIIGGFCTGETMGIAPFTEKNKMLLFSIGSTGPVVTDAGDYVFRSAASSADQGKQLSAYIDKNYKKVAILSELTDFSQSLLKVFKDNIKNATIVADETFATSERDLRAQLTKIKSSNPDAVIFIPQSIPTANLIAKQAFEIKLNISIIGAHTMAFEDTIKEYGQNLQDMVISTPLIDENTQSARKFFDGYNKKFSANCTIGVYCGYGYDGIYLLVDAISACGGAENTTCLRDYLYSIKNWNKGILGNISFDQNGDIQLQFVMQKLEGNKFVRLGD
jgi:branched-chain amino acid transport system substrate-binding protein